MFRYVLAHAGEHPALALAQAPPGLLSPREEAIFAGLTFRPRRRKWLLGRWAAKRLLGELATEGNGFVAGSLRNGDWRRQLSILNDEAGVPYVDREGQRLPLSLSISHRGDWGLAAVAIEPGVCIGADLETVEPRDPALVRQFFSESEAERVASGSDAERTIARIWSAKEAVLKALGIGLRHDTRDIVAGVEIAAPPGAPEAWRALDIRLASVLAARVSPRVFTVLWRDLDAHVVTVALLG